MSRFFLDQVDLDEEYRADRAQADEDYSPTLRLLRQMNQERLDSSDSGAVTSSEPTSNPPRDLGQEPPIRLIPAAPTGFGLRGPQEPEAEVDFGPPPQVQVQLGTERVFPPDAPETATDAPRGRRVISAGKTRLPVQVIGGVLDAAFHTVSAARQLLGNLGAISVPLPPVENLIPEIERTAGVIPNLARGVAQFFTPFLGWLGKVGALTQAIGLTGVAGGSAAAVGASALTTATAFDPRDPTLSTLLTQHPEEIRDLLKQFSPEALGPVLDKLPEALRNPVFQFLTIEKEDPALTARIKRGLEDLALGIPSEAILRTLAAAKPLWAARRFRGRIERAETDALASAADRTAFQAADTTKQLLDQTGGATYNLARGQNLAGQPAFAVSLHPERNRQVAGLATREDIKRFIDANADLLARDDRSLGVWFDRDAGVTHLDVVATVPSRQEAMALARQHGEKAAFDLNKVNPTTGAVAEGAEMFVEAPVTLTRFTDKAPGDFFDPGDITQRSGLRKGAEEARLANDPNAVAQLNFYEEVPEGVAGVRGPEPGVSRARFKSTAEIAPEDIYDVAADPLNLRAQSGADLNELGRLVRANGYRAIRNSERPGIVAVFDRLPVKSVEPRGTVAEAVEGALSVLRNERGSVQLDLPGIIPKRADTFDELAARYRQDVEAQTRGVRPREFARTEAAAAPLTPDDVRRIMPGTAVNDTEAIKVINVLLDSGVTIKGLAARVLNGETEAQPELIKQLYLHAQIDPQRLGVIAEGGRTLSVLNDPISGINAFLKQFENLFQNARANFTPTDLARIIDSFKSPDELTVFARSLQKPGALDIFFELWINGLLSGPKTLAANFVGNAAVVPSAVAERYAAAMFSPNISVSEANAFATRGLYAGLFQGWNLFWRSLKEGEPQFGELLARTSKVEGRPHTISPETFNATGQWGRAIHYLGTIIRLPTRILTATDDAFKALNYQMELNALATRKGVESARTKELAGFEATQEMKNVRESVLADPPVSVKASAERFAAYQTFTNEPGAFGQGLAELAKSPLGRIFLPFTRTPVNLAKYAGERTPLAVVMGDFHRAIGRGGADRDLALSKLALGSMTMAMIVQMAADGHVQGALSSDPNLRKEQIAAGMQSYSFVVRDEKGKATYISYNRLDPHGMIFGLASDIAQLAGHLDDDTFEEIATGFVSAVARQFSSKTWVKGLSDWLMALADPERGGARALQQFVGSLVPAAGAMGQAARAIDPTFRDVQNLVQAAASRVPGLSTAIPAEVNILGRPYWRGGGVTRDMVTGLYSFLSPIEVSRAVDDPVMQELIDQKIVVAPPQRFVNTISGPYQLEQPQYHDYAVFSGHELERQLRRIFTNERYMSASPERKELMVHEAVEASRERGRAQLRQKYPLLDSALREADRAGAATLRQRLPVTQTDRDQFIQRFQP